MLHLIESLDSAIASADDALAAAIADDAATMQRLRVLKEKQRVYSKYLKAEKSVLGVKRKNEANPEALADDTTTKSCTASIATNDSTSHRVTRSQRLSSAGTLSSKKGKKE